MPEKSEKTAKSLPSASELLANAPKVLGPKSVLYVLSVDTKERAALDIIRAIAEIEESGKPATLASVLEKAGGIHLAPRSKEFAKDPKKFIRGYVTNGLKPSVGLLAIR